ncbi:acetolactate synthase large subunit [Streptomyces sp. NPDC002018]|uniref:acetolactate synthase large subunit n=1 Tax=Streptomyces sp. NPDC002018 TaxID=3364629 RepID=UPI0036909717
MTRTGAVSGAEALLHSLVGAGVDVCFMNPGTSELHFVHALDSVREMRGVLALFEGVATGAADGYARMTGRPAAVLLHLGPGLGNGLANLHNARRAHSPLLCVVGSHATGHVRFDAPLQSDIEALARTVSGWVHTSGTARDVATDAVRAVRATSHDGGQVATLVLPADVSWESGAAPVPPRAPVPPDPVDGRTTAEAARALGEGGDTLLLLGGRALAEAGLRAADRIGRATGARLLTETFPARMECGAGVPTVEMLGYFVDRATEQLSGVRRIVLAGARAPVSFFAYPGRDGDLVPKGCQVLELAEPGQDVIAALEEIAARIAPGERPRSAVAVTEPPEPGPLSVRSLARAVALTLPPGAIVVEEAITSGLALPPVMATAARHTLLTLTGGAIGQGMPVATGAAIASPDRPVLSLEADGSALYTIQALWTQARERLDVTTVIINNSAYAILRMEMAQVRAGASGDRSARMLDLSDPVTDFVSLSQGLGVPARRVTTAEALSDALRDAYATSGPHLVEAMVPPAV